jgi:hypothetical protein
LKSFGERGGIGDIGDEYLCTLRRVSLQVSCVSADDANLLLASQKILRHNVSSIAACSKYNVHWFLLLYRELDARGWAEGSAVLVNWKSRSLPTSWQRPSKMR